MLDQLLATAEELRAEQEDLTARVHTNRDALRSLERANVLSPEQVKQVHGYYPPRKTRSDKRS